ncbi:hypothetical protein [Rhodococcus sp. NPDC049939]|uniref:hypothetical protein n=1 Tax=Rhodococcus sp. NPDC049939 TaxID=3155511 RepID=UPI0033E84FC9
MRLRGRQWWKLVGLAGMAGVAATGVVVIRANRQRKAYTPDEIRARLHERYTRAYASTDDGREVEPAPPTLRARLNDALRRRCGREAGTNHPSARRNPSAS